jgi:nucleotide-binding universal stress UspA family protein
VAVAAGPPRTHPLRTGGVRRGALPSSRAQHLHDRPDPRADRRLHAGGDRSRLRVRELPRRRDYGPPRLDPADASDHIAAGGRFDEWYEGARTEAERLFDRAERRAGDHGTSVRTVEEIGDPARTILEYADEEGFDQIVIGSHGRHGVARVLLGSVAETVLRRSRVPVVVVRGVETE